MSTVQGVQKHPFIHTLQTLKDRWNLTRKLLYFLIVLGLFLGGATYYMLTTTEPFQQASKTLFILLNIDVVVLLLLGTLIARRLVRLWASHRSGLAGAKLHSRLVLWFSLLSIIPAITVVLFSILFFNLGIEAWFSQRVQTALKESSAVAEAYFDEHKKVISADVKAMAVELSGQFPWRPSQAKYFRDTVNRLSELRSLNEAVVFTESSQVLAQSRFSFSLQFEAMSDRALKEAQSRVVIMQNEEKNRVRALVQISPDTDAYLLVGRRVDPQVLERIAQTENAVSEYNLLTSQRSSLEIQFALIFGLVALLLLLVAILAGLSFAGRLVKPLADLVQVADRIRAGDLKARVVESHNDDELGILGRAFNQMTTELVNSSRQMDRRRHFIETVLKGVSAGVIGLNKTGQINVMNASAAKLLHVQHQAVLGQGINIIFPEIQDLFKQITSGEVVQDQISLRRAGQTVTLLVRISWEKQGTSGITGYIITFDDVTELLQAQRSAAWADVARRIAHEIKNPLTPIHLSAERLKAKYSSQIQEGTENFIRYIETIERQVGHIGQMINEFSAFARMPEAILKEENLRRLCEQVLFMYANTHPHYQFRFICDKGKIFIKADAAQVDRLLTNLIKNSLESMEEFNQNHNRVGGKVILTLLEQPDQITLTIDDTGPGFPSQNRAYLLEPYVTKRQKGTGLGLAIVKRIMDSHQGEIHLEDAPRGGGRVRLVFPAYYTQKGRS